MISISKLDDNNVRIRFSGEDEQYRAIVSHHFSPMVEGAWFHPKYKMGVWDGKIRFFKELASSLPVMLVPEMLSVLQPYTSNISIDADIINMLVGETVDYEPSLPNPNFSFEGKYSFQKEAVQILLGKKRGLIQVATGGGKMAMIIATIKGAMELDYGKRYITIVPRKQLVEQFYDEFEIVGWVPKLAKLYGDTKEGLDYKYEVVIATWQTLSSLKKKRSFKFQPWINSFDGVIVDEVHGAKASVLAGILGNLECPFRAGFTGTMPNNKADKFTIISNIGPLLWKESAEELQRKDVLAQMFIRRINLKWPTRKLESFHAEKKWLENNDKRNEIISELARIEAKKDHNVLILVEKIPHGKALREILKEDASEGKINSINFISGSMRVGRREEIRKSMEQTRGNIIVATYGTFSLGINIKALHSIIFASPGKSEIRTIQSIGRGMRKAEGKLKLELYDIADSTKYATRHANARKKIYKQESFRFKDYDLKVD